MIRISQLTVGYRNKTVINRLSFSAGSNDSPLILAGRNGSGKSTLMKAILGKIPFGGKIEFDLPDTRIAWLPQLYQISFRVPVLDFVAMGGADTAGFFPSVSSTAVQNAIEALQQLGIGHLAEKPTDELSGGEWQLVCLAQMKTQDASVWLLDEPTSSLDIGYKSLVFDFLWEEAANGKTILLSTHDLPFLPSNGGSVLYLSEAPEFMKNSPENLDRVVSLLKAKRP
ncbi:MAG TPA: ATP-binding cassette domain-containing protein [Catalimonadaceae bacterium]|nr:ATP-binding cassette domain-containing protein [Catalimonadaceae bacterium]HPI10390.1 ATP-binding cassette domain-containing protein [Catalimonadaceae bacterium]